MIILRPNAMLNAALIPEMTMTTEIKASSQDRVKKALESLQAARTLQRDRLIYGVRRVNHYVEDVDGEWLEKRGGDEDDNSSPA